MKYWVYKDSRILGPFDKNDFASLPGFDAATLVCAGESAAAGEGDWLPAGDVAGLEAPSSPARPAAWPAGDPLMECGLLDSLQLDAASLLGDDRFPSAAETLFQDADLKRTFGDILAARPGVDAAELRRANDRAVELTVQLELLYKRVAELEAGQTDLVHRLAEKELQLRTRPAPVPASASPAASVPEPETPAAPASESHVSSDWPDASGGGSFPSFPARESPASAVPPAPDSREPEPPAPKPLFEKKAFKIAPAVKTFRVVGAEENPASVPPSAGAPAADPAPRKSMFETKTLKPVPTVKSFRIVEAEEPADAAAPLDAPAALPPAPAAPQTISPAANVFDWGAAAPAPQPAAPGMGVPPAAALPRPEVSVPAPETAWPPPAPLPAPPPIPAVAPSTTLSFGLPTQAPPATALFKVKDDMAGAPSTQAALAQLAKPAAAPPTKAPRAPRSNKGFLIGTGSLVVVMAVVGVLFLRQPKELKQMAALDDGRARMGVEPVDEAAGLPMVKPKMAAPPDAPAAAPQPSAVSATAPAAQAAAPQASAAPQAPAAAANQPAVEAPQAASQAKLDAAVAAVKDFPLDGERGTVAQWLQFSYSASPDAGRESWSASESAEKTYLVEYRFTPSARGDEVHYLFEVDMDRGFVTGKNLDAKSLLSGGPGAAEAKTKTGAKPRKSSARSRKSSAGQGAASQADLDAAVAAVRDFPLDGERGTVQRWLQSANAASPDAGRESWSASRTADKTYLVEYRFTPSAGGDEVRDDFEADMEQGFVTGKNADAKSILAGVPISSKGKAKAKPRKRGKIAKRAAKRPAAAAATKDVPLLPLPETDDLRPPAEDDGAFNSDTVH